MKRTLVIVSIIGGIIGVLVVLVRALIFLVELDHRIGQIEENSISTTSVRDRGNAIGFTNTGPQGNWSDVVTCPVNQYVCGLRQRVESPQQERIYYSGMNGIEFYCCPLDPD